MSTTETAPPAATTETAAAPAAKGGKGKPGAATKAAIASVTPKAPDVPARPDEAAVVATHLPGHADVTVAGQKKLAEEAEKAAAAAEEAATGRTEAKTLDQIKAARRAKAAADAEKVAAGATDAKDKSKDKDKPAAAAAGDDKAKVEPAKKEAEEKAKTDADEAAKLEAAKTKTVETDIPAEKLKEFTKLNRELRETTAKVRALEADAVPLAERLKKATELAKAGKHHEAIRAAGLDFDAAAREVLELQAEEETDPKIKKLREDLAETAAKLAKLEEGQTTTKKTSDEAAKAVATQARKEWEERVIAQVTLAADSFPYLSKSDAFVREALAEADSEYPDIVKGLKRNLTDEEKDNVLIWKLEEAEKKHAARAKLYGKAPKREKTEETDKKPEAGTGAAAATGAGGATTIDANMRAGVTTVGKPFRKRTLQEIRAERRQAGGR